MRPPFAGTGFEATRHSCHTLLRAPIDRKCRRQIGKITARPSTPVEPVPTGPVDGESVPVRHFGGLLDTPAWRNPAERPPRRDVEFHNPPQIRFAGQTGEQATLFFRDPSDNALEFNAFANPEDIGR